MRTPVRFKAEAEYGSTMGRKANKNLPVMAVAGNGDGATVAVAGRANFYWIRLVDDDNRLTQCYSIPVLSYGDVIYVAKAKDRKLTYYEFVAFIQDAGGGTSPPIWVHDHSSNAQGGQFLDLNGAADALVLDADGDTSISAPTDDQIDFEVGGTDVARLIAAGLVLDDGAGDSPYVGWIGGSNDDTGFIYLEDDVVQYASRWVFQIPAQSGEAGFAVFRDRGGTDILQIAPTYVDVKTLLLGDRVSLTYSNAANPMLELSFSDASTNTIIEMMRLGRATSGVAAAGLGSRILFRLEDDGGTTEDAIALDAVWSDAAAASEDSYLSILGRKAGAALGEFARVSGDGITLPDGAMVGLGAAAGRLVWSDATPDTLTLEDANFDLAKASALLRFIGTVGGGGGITYRDSGSSDRYALLFPGSDVVALCNRASNGVVQIRANTATAGGGGEVTVAEFYDDNVLFNVNVGIGTAAGTHHLRVEDTALDITTGWMGIRNIHTKTAGATDRNDDFYGYYANTSMSQAGGTIGDLIGLYSATVLNDGTVGDGTEDLRGMWILARMAGGTVTDDFFGGYILADLNAGEVADNAFGFQVYTDLEAGVTVGGNFYAFHVRGDSSATITGTAYMLYLHDVRGMDYALYHSGSSPSYFGGPVGVKTTSPDAAFQVVGDAMFGDDGTNYASFASDGELTLHGTARVIRDLWIDAAGIKAPGAKPASEVSFGTLETAAWEFSNEGVGANQESVSWRIAIPYDLDRTEGVIIRIGWSSASTGNCKWQLKYRWFSEDEDMTQDGEETLTVVDAASATANGLVITTIEGINAPSATDVTIMFKLTRLSADAQDTISDTVELHGVCFNYISDKLGEPT